MSHNCKVKGSSTVCFEIDNELWVKEYADIGSFRNDQLLG